MTATTSTNVSTRLTEMVAEPALMPSAGEGAPGRVHMVDDLVAIAAADAATSAASNVGSTYRLCEFPTNAKVKRVVVLTDDVIDSNATQTAAISFSVAFSNSKSTPAALRGLLPSSAKDGSVVAEQSASRNKVFGTITLSGNNVAIPRTDITLAGTLKAGDLVKPLWAFFGFVNGRGDAQDPGGKFDLFAKFETASATGHAGNLYASVEYAS